MMAILTKLSAMVIIISWVWKGRWKPNFPWQVCVWLFVEFLNINNIDDISDALPDDKIYRQTVFHELSEEVVRLAWPQVDKVSIRQASTVADETQVPTDDQDDDHNSLEDTVLYWDDGHEFEDTLPYYESEDEFGKTK